MPLLNITKQIIKMYELPVNPSKQQWCEVFESFNNALEDCDDLNVLLECIFYDSNWYLPFNYRLDLMNKAKSLGANSYDFLADYYSYKVSFLDPGKEYDEAVKELNSLSPDT